MGQKNLVTQGELSQTIAGLSALANNLNEHVNQSLSKAHGWSLLDSAYLDTGGNYHTDYAGSSLVSIPGLFNTGVNNNGTLAVPGTNDQHWALIQSAAHSFPGPASPILNPLPGNYSSNGPNSQWIGVKASGSVPDGTYKWRLSFNLTGLNAATAIINGVWASDNQTTAVLLNGVTTGYKLGDGTEHKQPAAKFQLNGPFLSGVNTLDFVISNNNGPASLRVEISGKAAIGGVFAIPGIRNTGVKVDNSGLATLGSVDPNWKLIQSAEPTNPGPNAIVITPLNSAWAKNTAVSQWIGPRVSGNSSSHIGDYVYRLSFDLTGFAPNTVILKGTFVSDNVLTNIYVNGAATGITNNQADISRTYKYTTSFVIASGFLSGINTLDIKVNNRSASSSGFRLEMTGTAAHAGTNLASRVLRLTVGGNVFYFPAQVSGGMDGVADPTIPKFTGIVSPQSADPASDLTVGSPTPAELVTTFAALLNTISTSATDTLMQHAGTPAEGVHGGVTWQTESVATSGGYIMGRRSVNVTISGVQYKLIGDIVLAGPLNA